MPLTPLLKVGHPRELIVATAEALGVDLLVIGAHSQRSFLDVLLGARRPPSAAGDRRVKACPSSITQTGAPFMVVVHQEDHLQPG